MNESPSSSVCGPNRGAPVVLAVIVAGVPNGSSGACV